MGDLTREQARKDLMTGVNTHECICEFLRLAYDEVHELSDGPRKEVLRERLTDCFVMGKKMQNRLIYYRQKYPDDPGSQGHNLKHMPGAEEKLQMRQARTL